MRLRALGLASSMRGPGVLIATTLVACAPAPRPAAPPSTPEPTPAPAQSATPQMHQGVTEVDVRCEGREEEQCNALDDDCDGAIDEGCGYSSGGVQVTIRWDSGADIDLYVRDPSGEAVFYNKEHRKTPVGGHLDHDARGDCRPEQPHPHIENAYWPEPAPPGEYGVELHYFGPCGGNAETRVQMSVSVSDHILGVYEYLLSPEEKAHAVDFEVP